MGTKKKKKKQSKYKKVLILLLLIIIAGAATFITSYTAIYNRNNNKVSATQNTSESKTNETKKDEGAVVNKTRVNQSTNNKTIDNKVINKSTAQNNKTVNSSNAKSSTTNKISTTINNTTISSNKSTQKQATSQLQSFTKADAIEYFQKSRSEYGQYQVAQTDYGYSLSSNGKAVIGLVLFDVETSPETGLKYYGYKLQNLDLVSQGGSGTIENGYIYEDGSVEVE